MRNDAGRTENSTTRPAEIAGQLARQVSIQAFKHIALTIVEE